MLGIMTAFGISMIVHTVHAGLDGLSRPYVMNISFDIATLIFDCAIFFLCLLDWHDGEKQSMLFMSISGLVALALFADYISWMADGNPQLNSLALVFNTIPYLCETALAFLMWRYTRTILNLKDRKYRIISVASDILAVISAEAILFNMKDGFYFTINEQGVYKRGSLYLVSHAYMIIVLLVTIIVILKKKLPRQQKIALLSYCALPVIAGGTMVLTYGLSYAYPAVFISVILCYGSLYMSKSMELATKRKELEYASAIQENMLPGEFKPDEGGKLDVFGLMHPAREVGGDFYNYYRIDDTHLVVMIADVSGKGAPAAMFMMRALSTITDLMDAGLDLETVAFKTNDKLAENNDSSLFVTAWVGVIDTLTGEIKYINAGHCFPVLIKSDGKADFVRIKPKCPLAAMEGIRYPVNSVKLESGDTLFLYTDGVTEANNRRKKLYGDDRLIDACSGNVTGARELCDGIVASINEFTAGTEQFDDITMLAVKYY